MTDLLYIPAFLRAGSPESLKAREEGAARLAALPATPRPRSSRLVPLKGAIPGGLAKAKAEDELNRGYLKQLGYSPTFIGHISLKTAKKIVEDIRLGLGAVREDQA
jgi:hypothetical protein